MRSDPLMSRDYRTINYVSGPIMFVQNPIGVSYGETARITLPDGEIRTGQVLDISREMAVVQVFEGHKRG